MTPGIPDPTQPRSEPHPPATPWVSASEFQPPASPQGDRPREEKLLDEVDEASKESFPCSDPPSYTHCHA